jgi:crotonobetaine/carnitine-CoA ligase
MPEETARVIRPDGWLRPGDLVVENPEGIYTFVGREKEIIRRRGENLSPAEVEEALATHPDVAEVAVIGVPSDLSEEEVKAFVVATPGAAADPGALHAWAAERLTRFKVPRYLEFIPELPHTATGRIAKHQLPRERTANEWDADTRHTGSAAHG